MALVPLASLLPGSVLPYVPGCPEQLAAKELAQAARQFCLDSWAWRETISGEGLALAAGATLFTIPIPAGYEAAVEAVPSLWRGADPRPLDKRLYSLRPDGALVFERPGEAGGEALKLEVVWNPGLSVDAAGMPLARLPDWLLSAWGAAISSGALARLQAMTKKPWGDPDQFRQNLDFYRDAVGRAKLSYWSGGKGADAITLTVPEFV
jgi:hypothetical protein